MEWVMKTAKIEESALRASTGAIAGSVAGIAIGAAIGGIAAWWAGNEHKRWTNTMKEMIS